MWRLNLPLVQSGSDLNVAQIIFLMESDPMKTTEKRGEKKDEIFMELATGMPPEIAKEQLKKIGIQYHVAD